MRAIQAYSSFALASNSVAERKNVIQFPTPAKFADVVNAVDAVAVEVVPPVVDTSSVYLTRAQAAIRLYTSIYHYNDRPKSSLNVST
jgi:hypothetical protein